MMDNANVEMAVVPELTYKIVNDASIARKLLKDGYKIGDIKPKRGHERETIFVFEITEGFMDKLQLYISEKKNNKEKGKKDGEKNS